MDKKILDEIQLELNRFQKTLKEAQTRSEEEKGWYSSHHNEWLDVNKVSGTREAGSVKRAALDLKRLLTKLL